MQPAPGPADPTALERYARSGHRSVEGWLMPAAIALLLRLAGTQQRLGIRGPVVEIGVHHGRLFLLLHLLAAADEASVAYDLFESQDENVDGSGQGDRARLEANLRRHGVRTERARIRAVNSLRLTPESVLADGGGPVRLFSVDGGHTAEITASDLALAERVLCPGGLLVLDDFFNEAWPGVAEGTCRHLFGPTALVPVAIGGNKLVLTNDAALALAYRQDLAAPGGRWEVRHQVFLGHPVIVFAPSPHSALRRSLASSAPWRALRVTPVGRALRRLLRRLLRRA